MIGANPTEHGQVQINNLVIDGLRLNHLADYFRGLYWLHRVALSLLRLLGVS